MMSSKIKVPQVRWSWLFKMAWRDSRRNRSKVMLFVLSIVLGIGALVAVFSFRNNLQNDIENQAKMLTGADLVIESRKAIKPNISKVLDSLGDETSEERSFASMVYFIRGGGSRLVQVKALQGDFPYYGELETTPATASEIFGSTQGALVDQTVMLQYGAKPGDSISIGAVNFKIEGALNKAPGQSGVSTTVAPVIYIPLKYLEKTGLTKIGSRIQYKRYFKYHNQERLEEDIKKREPFFEKEDLDTETVESRKESTGKSFKDVTRFLALSGFVALLLGCIGVGSSIQVYIKEKMAGIATLRCLGLKSKDAFLIYLIQVIVIGFIGASLGAVFGTGLQFLLPMVLKDFLPLELTMTVSWLAIVQGLALGMLISILFALPALLSVRNISPLNALRSSFEGLARRDFLIYAVYLLIVLFVLAFSRLQMTSWLEAGIFTIGICIACGILYCITKLLMWLVKLLLPARAGYVYRQGFANLYRPNNQTMVLSISIGLATTFICTLFFVQDILVKRVTISSQESQANMVLFDIQSNQKDSVADIARSFKLPIISEVPIVTVRLESINGKTAKDIIADSAATEEQNSKTPSERAFRGELRVTFQEKLTDAEKVVKGKWTGEVDADGGIKVSLEDGYARRIRVDVGDSLVFNVQGTLVPAVVGSLRQVNWTRMQTNFRVVFPIGVLEEAPQFHVLMTRVPSEQVSADFQGAVVRRYPNISAIDLGLILKVLEDVLSKISFVIQFMSAFSIITGWVVLISSILNNKDQRLREHVLLRTLGASRKQIVMVTAVEHLCLGALAAGTGIILSVTASWLLATYSFDAVFVPSLSAVGILFCIVVLITVLTGVLSSRKIFNTPPIAILNS